MLLAAAMTLLPIAPLPAQAGEEPPASEEEKGKATCQDVSPPGSGNSTPVANAPDQASATSKTCEEQAATSWATPPKESLLKKILRVLYGPNKPPGPNTDVDTNISAGGAAGGEILVSLQLQLVGGNFGAWSPALLHVQCSSYRAKLTDSENARRRRLLRQRSAEQTSIIFISSAS